MIGLCIILPDLITAGREKSKQYTPVGMPFAEALQNRTSLFKLPQRGTMEPDRPATGRVWFRALFVVAVAVMLTLAAAAIMLTVTAVAVVLPLAAAAIMLTVTAVAVVLPYPAVAAVILTGSFLHFLQYPLTSAQPSPGLHRKQ